MTENFYEEIQFKEVVTLQTEGSTDAHAITKAYAESLLVSGYDEATGLTTTSATLEDITGLTFDITTPATGYILATMTVECTAAGASVAGAWAISINAVDGTEIGRFIGTATDTGSVTVQAKAALAAGTYTVKGRHRRVSGATALNTDVAQLSATFHTYGSEE